jgi:hypothetical protein
MRKTVAPRAGSASRGSGAQIGGAGGDEDAEGGRARVRTTPRMHARDDVRWWIINDIRGCLFGRHDLTCRHLGAAKTGINERCG